MTKKGVVDWWVSVNIVTSSIVRSAKCRYFSNAEADFEVFCPAGATCCSNGVKLSTDCQKLQPEMDNCNRK